MTGHHQPPQGYVDMKRGKRMARVDDMPPDLRALVNEYGLAVVDACMQNGVRKPRRIRHIVETVLDEFSPTRGSHSVQGLRKDVATGLVMRAPSGGGRSEQ
jgi:hypothetical protein